LRSRISTFKSSESLRRAFEQVFKYLGGNYPQRAAFLADFGGGLGFSGIIPASLVSQVAAGDVHSGRHAIRGSATAMPLV